MIKKMMQPLKATLVSLWLLTALHAHALELVNWNKAPIKLSLNQDDERMVILDKNVSVGLPSSLEGKLRIQSLSGVLYLKSSEPFTETRLMVKDLETGEIILIDVTGNGQSKTTLETVKIVSDMTSQTTDGSSEIQGEVATAENEQSLPVPVLLTRYAAQNYYAPLRAIEKVPGIKQISLSLPSTLTRLLPQLPVIVKPESVWRLRHYEVVAIRIINQSANAVNLDPRLLQGQFYSATFQHNTLGPKGQSTDTTMVYIVTQGRAQNAFLPEPMAEENQTNPSKNKSKRYDRGGK